MIFFSGDGQNRFQLVEALTVIRGSFAANQSRTVSIAQIIPVVTRPKNISNFGCSIIETDFP
jgi:hypothetical protein